jgi:hypothetical protein
MAGDVRGRVVEEVLAVVEVKDWEATRGILVIFDGEVDEKGAVVGVGEDGRVEAVAVEAGDFRVATLFSIRLIVGGERRGAWVSLCVEISSEGGGRRREGGRG